MSVCYTYIHTYILTVNKVNSILNRVADCVIVLYVVRPHDTPFEDGTFKLTISFTEEYPNKPPTVRFVSKMFHPNGAYHYAIYTVVHKNVPVNFFAITFANINQFK